VPNWLRALIAGYGAKKLGGGCFTTILVFVVIYFVLGQCNHPVVQHAGLKPTYATSITKLNNGRQNFICALCKINGKYPEYWF
jgi:hypothetical protein